MKIQDHELDRLAARIHYLHGSGEAAEARDQLVRFAKSEISAALDEIERRGDANIHGDIEPLYGILAELRDELCIQRKEDCSPEGCR